MCWQLSVQSAFSVTGMHVQACRGAHRPKMGQPDICKGEHALFKCQRKPHVAAVDVWPVNCGLNKALPSIQALHSTMHPAVCSTSDPLALKGVFMFLQVAQQVTLANDLQKNQRVAVRREHVIEVNFAYDDED